MTTPRHLSDRYELGETIGFGGMSEVHLARDNRLSRDVAIKILRADLARDPSFYLRFRREAQNAAALNHPAIVAVYDTGEAETDAGPLPYIVMEYVDGDTLRDIVRVDGPVTPRQAMTWIADVCAALDFSHRNGIVHRDVKPANIMINRAGDLKVMDFGIARSMSDGANTMTQTAAVIGTAQYLSPEQARGEQVDARSDVYSVGCVLYELLTGEPPFTGDSPVAVAYQHVREDPRPPSLVHAGVPRELDSVILKAMSKNPANRYQSAAEMRADLVRVLGGHRPSAPTVMTEEDRTTILGTNSSRIDATPHRIARNTNDVAAAKAPGVGARSVAPSDTGDDGEGRGKIIGRVLLGALAVALVALIAVFLLKFNNDSTGQQVGVPHVAGQTADDARVRLLSEGFETLNQLTADSNVEEGKVIRTAPAGGTSAAKGSTITIIVSTGKERVTVPDLKGLSQQQAVAELSRVGLRANPTPLRATSTIAERDKVISSEPSSGSSIAIDTQVTITLGGGPEQVRVPDVTGQNISVAQANIEGAGFTVNIVETDSSKPAGDVLQTTPAGGQTADQGANVTITVSNGARIQMPDLRGQTPSEAVEALKALGWTGDAKSLTQTPVNTLDTNQVGRIQRQQQPAGSQIAKAAVVVVGVGTLGIPN